MRALYPNSQFSSSSIDVAEQDSHDLIRQVIIEPDSVQLGFKLVDSQGNEVNPRCAAVGDRIRGNYGPPDQPAIIADEPGLVQTFAWLRNGEVLSLRCHDGHAESVSLFQLKDDAT